MILSVKTSLTAQKEDGLKRKLVGIEVTGRGIPRHGYKVVSEDGEEIGIVTSGTQSPTLKKSIGLALISVEHAEVGTPLKVEIRNKQIEAVVVKAPFYKKVINKFTSICIHVHSIQYRLYANHLI